MRVMMAYDGSPCAEAAVDDLGRAGLPSKVELLLVSVTETWLPPPSGLELVTPGVVTSIHERTEAMKEHVSRIADRLRGRFPSWSVESMQGAGSPAAVLLQKADEWRPDLIVVGSHGAGPIQRFLIGSVSQRVATHAPCSVRIARGRLEDGTTEGPARLVVGLDGSIDSAMAVEVVAHRRWAAGTEVRLITSIGPMVSTHSLVTFPEEKSQVEGWQSAAANRLQEAGLQVSTVLSFEDPKKAIVHEAETWGAETIFVGSHGRGAVARFLLGSVSTAVAARAHCTVEIVRSTSTVISTDFEEGGSGTKG
jgi:nucleotide-binding universal stress UspA family protein